MSIVIGIDTGISSTKVIGVEDGKHVIAPTVVKCSDAATAVGNALDRYLHDNGIARNDIAHIMYTGSGAHEATAVIDGCPMTRVDEFTANGLGARFDSGLDRMVVVSMGTGTSLVRVDGEDIRHIGGIGMGGGTLLGLAQLLLGTSDMAEITRLAEDGDPARVNLLIGDLSSEKLDGLIQEATASLFAKASQQPASVNDIAAGLIHMVLETIGSAVVLSQLQSGIKDYVLIGRLAELASRNRVIPLLEKLYGVRFHIPKHAAYCTALGAALSHKYENRQLHVI